MTIRELLAASGSGAKVIDKQTFTASGTWTKPAGVLDTDEVQIDLWGPGGSGGVQASNASLFTGAPGSGGAHNRVKFLAGELNASENISVGSGGAAVTASSISGSVRGKDGGYSEFKGYRAYGGGGGGLNTADPAEYSSGGGTLSAGLSYNGNSYFLGGAPYELVPSVTSNPLTNASATAPLYNVPGEWGGGPVIPGTMTELMRPQHGGAAGSVASVAADPIWRSSIWGGAAGGGYSGTAGSQSGGTSQFGGNGGSVAIPASNTTNANGGNGSPRGGGGAGAKWGSTGTVTSGAGGRGEVVITIFRK